jgi:hypothetical protein
VELWLPIHWRLHPATVCYKPFSVPLFTVAGELVFALAQVQTSRTVTLFSENSPNTSNIFFHVTSCSLVEVTASIFWAEGKTSELSSKEFA